MERKGRGEIVMARMGRKRRGTRSVRAEREHEGRREGQEGVGIGERGRTEKNGGEENRGKEKGWREGKEKK